MESKIQKQIIDYFSFFEEFHNTARTCLKNCQNYAIAINKLILRCRKIQGADVKGTPLEQFFGLQEKLAASLHNLISEEIEEIRNSLSQIEDLLDKLCIKYRALQESCREVNFADRQSLLIKGTPFQPPLKQLLEFAEDTLTFGSEVCAKVDTSFRVISLKGLNSESQVDNFKISGSWQQRIPEILAYTSFISENQI